MHDFFAPHREGIADRDKERDIERERESYMGVDRDEKFFEEEDSSALSHSLPHSTNMPSSFSSSSLQGEHHQHHSHQGNQNHGYTRDHVDVYRNYDYDCVSKIDENGYGQGQGQGQGVNSPHLSRYNSSAVSSDMGYSRSEENSRINWNAHSGNDTERNRRNGIVGRTTHRDGDSMAARASSNPNPNPSTSCSSRSYVLCPGDRQLLTDQTTGVISSSGWSGHSSAQNIVRGGEWRGEGEGKGIGEGAVYGDEEGGMRTNPSRAARRSPVGTKPDRLSDACRPINLSVSSSVLSWGDWPEKLEGLGGNVSVPPPPPDDYGREDDVDIDPKGSDYNRQEGGEGEGGSDQHCSSSSSRPSSSGLKIDDWNHSHTDSRVTPSMSHLNAHHMQAAVPFLKSSVGSGHSNGVNPSSSSAVPHPRVEVRSTDSPLSPLIAPSHTAAPSYNNAEAGVRSGADIMRYTVHEDRASALPPPQSSASLQLTTVPVPVPLVRPLHPVYSDPVYSDSNTNTIPSANPLTVSEKTENISVNSAHRKYFSVEYEAMRERMATKRVKRGTERAKEREQAGSLRMFRCSDPERVISCGRIVVGAIGPNTNMAHNSDSLSEKSDPQLEVDVEAGDSTTVQPAPPGGILDNVQHRIAVDVDVYPPSAKGSGEDRDLFRRESITLHSSSFHFVPAAQSKRISSLITALAVRRRCGRYHHSTNGAPSTSNSNSVLSSHPPLRTNLETTRSKTSTLVTLRYTPRVPSMEMEKEREREMHTYTPRVPSMEREREMEMEMEMEREREMHTCTPRVPSMEREREMEMEREMRTDASLALSLPDGGTTTSISEHVVFSAFTSPPLHVQRYPLPSAASFLLPGALSSDEEDNQEEDEDEKKGEREEVKESAPPVHPSDQLLTSHQRYPGSTEAVRQDQGVHVQSEATLAVHQHPISHAPRNDALSLTVGAKNVPDTDSDSDPSHSFTRNSYNNNSSSNNGSSSSNSLTASRHKETCRSPEEPTFTAASYFYSSHPSPSPSPPRKKPSGGLRQAQTLAEKRDAAFCLLDSSPSPSPSPSPPSSSRYSEFVTYNYNTTPDGTAHWEQGKGKDRGKEKEKDHYQHQGSDGTDRDKNKDRDETPPASICSVTFDRYKYNASHESLPIVINKHESLKGIKGTSRDQRAMSLSLSVSVEGRDGHIRTKPPTGRSNYPHTARDSTNGAGEKSPGIGISTNRVTKRMGEASVKRAQHSTHSMSCCVCLRSEDTDTDPLLSCSGCCGSAVHSECYGMSAAPQRDGKRNFLCESCEERDTVRERRNTAVRTGDGDFEEAKMVSPKCVLCKKSSGMMKRGTCGSWTHLLCVLFTAELTVDEHTGRPNNLRHLDPERAGLVCKQCE